MDAPPAENRALRLRNASHIANIMQTMGSITVWKLRNVERLLLGIGLALMAVWVAARIHAGLGSNAAIKRFHAGILTSSPPPPSAGLDFSEWSPQRITAYKDSLVAEKDPPLAILRIPKIRLEVPIFDNTDDLTLNLGVGRIAGTAKMGQAGNLGIAGHRDGFFRGLKDVTDGDVVELLLAGRTEQYVVSNIQIVNPEDVSVLGATPVPTLTLVTCYPFYFVGSAPQRYIVTASKKVPGQADKTVDTSSSFMGKKINHKENPK